MKNDTASCSATVVERLCHSWPKRAAVRNPSYSEDSEASFDRRLFDFPPRLLPFASHPAFVALDDGVKRRIETLAWIAWNRRVVDTEELVVCKALVGLMAGDTDIRLEGAARTAIRHTLIDEAFHSHMHEAAVEATVRARRVPPDVVGGLHKPAYSYRSLEAAMRRMSEPWEREIARLTWAVVGELSIYEFLTIVSRDSSIQPASRELLELHEKDEAAHASIVAEVMREHFHELGRAQRECFTRCLPLATSCLSQQDWEVWKDILDLAGVQAAAEIIADAEHDPSVPDELPLLRSYARIDALCAELDIDYRKEAS